MKLKNYDYVLLSNVLITGILQFNYFNVVGLISIILSTLYLCILLFSKYRSKILTILFFVSIITGIVYYLLNPLFENSNISMVSILPAMFLLFGIIHAITMPSIKRNFFSGVRTSLALKNDDVWKKVNYIGSIIYYITLFPLYIMVLYFDDSSKAILSILMVVIFAFLTLGIALYIEKKYKVMIRQQEMNDLQEQRRKETGG